MRILSVSSSRADVSILAPVWRALVARDDVELQVLLTGMHRADDGATARGALPEGVTVRLDGADLGGKGGAEASEACAAILTAAATAIGATEPDLMLLIGDRLDMAPCAYAASCFRLPVAHLHGGELSQGVVDDRLRHAITKLSHLHCVAHPMAANRVARMGEEPWRITVTGAPGLDGLRAEQGENPAVLASRLGFGGLADLRLVTVHPETNAADPAAPLSAVLAALEARPGPTLFTATNSDPGAGPMRAAIAGFVARHPWAREVGTLGAAGFATILRHGRLVLGNSSAGIIEAEFAGMPSITIGRRQDGRERGPSVISVSAEPDAIIAALDRAPPRHEPGRGVYGDGHAAPRIVAALLGGLSGPRARERLLSKRFHIGADSFTAPWVEVEVAA